MFQSLIGKVRQLRDEGPGDGNLRRFQSLIGKVRQVEVAGNQLDTPFQSLIGKVRPNTDRILD